MYENWTANAAVAAATATAVSLAVLVHYEGLLLLARRLQHPAGRQRVKVLYAIFSVLGLHVLEIWIFGLVLWQLLQWPECGRIAGEGAKVLPGLLDSIYFSAITFTTVGFGDMVPLGPIRFLSGTEALTGFVLITWSASFTFLEMSRFWRHT